MMCFGFKITLILPHITLVGRIIQTLDGMAPIIVTQILRDRGHQKQIGLKTRLTSGIYQGIRSNLGSPLEKMMADQTEMMKQMSEMISKFVNQQVLPSQTVPNPNNKPEHQNQNGNSNGKRVVFVEPGPSRQNAQSIKLRSGRNVENPYRQSGNDKISDDEKGNTTNKTDSSDEEMSIKNETIRIPFPEALKMRRKKIENNTQEIEDSLQNVVIEIPLFKALEQIPSYAKFMKEKCTPRCRSRNQKDKGKTIVPTVHTITVMPELPTKKTDPGAPIISCSIAENTFRNVLLDDGASVNLLPASVVEKFNLGVVKPTSMTLEFADRSSTQPKGVLEDVIVKYKDADFQ